MANYKIIEVDIDDIGTLFQVNNLLNEVFGGVSENELKLNTTTLGENKSLYLAAVENNEIIGFNCFISHTFFVNNKKFNCYQSCWTATSNLHRGKRVFQNLIEEAKKILLSRSAGFIFGFPNESSYPIFIHKLGFKEHPSLKLNIANVRFVHNLYLNGKTPTLVMLNKDAILQNNAELYILKKARYGEKLIKIEINNSYIWGIVRVKMYKKVKLSFFDVGGIEIQNITDISHIIKKICKTQRISYIHFVTTKYNSYNNLFRGFKPASTNNLIVYDLKLDTSSYNFNFLSGIKDVY